MSAEKAFVDTNILIYAHDRGADQRHQIAQELIDQLWRDRSGAVSTQVLQEFYVNVRRQAKNPLSKAEAKRLIRDYLSWEVVIIGGEDVLHAIDLETRYKISFWDAMIIQAANAADADILYTEDLNDRQRYGSVVARNPFAEVG